MHCNDATGPVAINMTVPDIRGAAAAAAAISSAVGVWDITFWVNASVTSNDTPKEVVNITRSSPVKKPVVLETRIAKFKAPDLITPPSAPRHIISFVSEAPSTCAAVAAAAAPAAALIAISTTEKQMWITTVIPVKWVRLLISMTNSDRVHAL